MLILIIIFIIVIHMYDLFTNHLGLYAMERKIYNN